MGSAYSSRSVTVPSVSRWSARDGAGRPVRPFRQRKRDAAPAVGERRGTLRNRASHGRSAGWMAIFDPGAWLRALLAAALMWALACTVTLTSDTTGHDWYAAGKLTLTEILTGLGFDDRATVEYRTSDGSVVTLTRDGLMYNGNALVARDYLLRTAAKAAELGAWFGLGGALLCLALFRRPEDERQYRRAASGPEHLPGPEARTRFAPPAVALSSASSPQVRARENRPSASRDSRPPGKDRRSHDADKLSVGAESRQPDAPAPPPPARRERQYGRWI